MNPHNWPAIVNVQMATPTGRRRLSPPINWLENHGWLIRRISLTGDCLVLYLLGNGADQDTLRRSIAGCAGYLGLEGIPAIWSSAGGWGTEAVFISKDGVESPFDYGKFHL